MKYLLIVLILFASCKKNSSDNSITVSAYAHSNSQNFVSIDLQFSSPITVNGSATVQFDIYTNGVFSSSKQLSFGITGTSINTFHFDSNFQLSSQQQGARNVKAISISGASNYNFIYK